jgi:ABC-type uncharacterized transport system substrate-binding protein
VLTEALRGHGWVEGKNLAIEYRFGGERYERLRALADELVRLKVDLIFAASAPSAQAAKEVTSTIPIVSSRQRTRSRFSSTRSRRPMRRSWTRRFRS